MQDDIFQSSIAEFVPDEKWVVSLLADESMFTLCKFWLITYVC